MHTFKTLALLFFLVAIPAERSMALGLGLVLGGATGITLKESKWSGSTYEGAIFLGKRTRIQAHYLIQKRRFYYGFGARLKLPENQDQDAPSEPGLALKKKKDDDDGDGDESSADSILNDISLRVPVGMRFFFKEVELFGELGLLVPLKSDDGFSLGTELALGARVYL